MSWVEVPLHRVADLESGFGFPRERQGDSTQEIPFFRVSDMNLDGNEVLMSNHTNTVSEKVLAALHARAFPSGTVIFPKIGAAIATEKKRILIKPATYDNNVMGAVPKSVVVPRFLYYWFLRLRLSDFASASHVPSIRKSVMEQIPFNLPPPSEQRRIVEILDQADVLRKLRRDADAKAARILPALFLKMFGDPATNPMGWSVKKLSDVASTTSGGTPDTKNGAYYGGAIPWIKSGELSSRTVTRTEQTITEEGLRNSSAKWIEPGAILVAMYGATVGQVARLGIRATTNQAICAITPGTAIEPEFLAEFLRLSKQQLLDRRVGGAQPNISQQIIRALNVPVPPPALQQQFARIALTMEATLDELSALQPRLGSLSCLLAQRAFSGQLTAKWRQAHMQELLVEMQEQARQLNLPAPN